MGREAFYMEEKQAQKMDEEEREFLLTRLVGFFTLFSL
jgi:hypothetical protein